MKTRARVFWQEHRSLVLHGVWLLGLGVLYYLLILFTPLRIPCVFYQVTGLACPGCGVSRLCLELAQLHIWEAARQNWAVAVLVPLWAVVGVVEFFFNPKSLAKGGALVNWLTWGSVVLLLLFGVLRNLPPFAFLLPTHMQ